MRDEDERLIRTYIPVSLSFSAVQLLSLFFLVSWRLGVLGVLGGSIIII
jgi:hypothetical protein